MQNRPIITAALSIHELHHVVHPLDAVQPTKYVTDFKDVVGEATMRSTRPF